MDELKREIVDYWTGREERFEALRLDELNSNKRQRWLDELHEYLPSDRPLDILDIGTGTGFFCFLLAAEGHRLTGIDLTEAMILGARRTADLLDLHPDFRVMDAEAPTFAPESFRSRASAQLSAATKSVLPFFLGIKIKASFVSAFSVPLW